MDIVDLIYNGFYPFRMVSSVSGFVVFAYLLNDDGTYSGTKDKPDLNEWIMYRYHIKLEYSEN